MSLLGQFVRFAGIGGLCTALQYLILVALVVHLRVHPVVASTAGYIGSALLNYQLNRVYTFRSDARHLRALPRFAVISTVGLLLNATVLGLLNSGLKVHYLWAQVVATVIILIWNFLANRCWTFADSEVE